MGDERLDWGTPLFYIIWGEELREMEDSGKKEREEKKKKEEEKESKTAIFVHCF